MCALFGALIGNTSNPLHLTAISKLLNHVIRESNERGRDGYGFISGFSLIGDKPNDFVIKANYLTLYPEVKQFGGLPSSINVLGNFRAEPASQYVADKSEDDQQPYISGDWSVVHNGTVRNANQLRTHTVNTSIDSAAIVECLDRQGDMFENLKSTFKAFYNVVKDLEGSFGILARHRDYNNCMFLATNYRPIWYAIAHGAVVFASSEEYFDKRICQQPVMVPPYTVCLFEVSEEDLKIHNLSLREMKDETESVLVLASGGMDSTVAACVCMERGYAVTLLHLDYGCRATQKEIEALCCIGEALSLPIVRISINAYDTADSPLLSGDSVISNGKAGSESGNEHVPARNLLMLSTATAYAEAKGFDYIALGNNMEEAGSYPDNEPEFVRQFNKILPFAVGENVNLQVMQPVGDMTKHEIVKTGLELEAPLHLTWSCYKEGAKHCGTCPSCFMRKMAFKINEKPEVIEYLTDEDV